MPFIITDPCIETKDTACVDVCPVDCIHPRKDEPEFAQVDDALHPSGGVHRLRRVRAGVPGRGDLREHRRDAVAPEGSDRGQRHLPQRRRRHDGAEPKRSSRSTSPITRTSWPSRPPSGRPRTRDFAEDRHLERQRHPGASRAGPGMDRAGAPGRRLPAGNQGHIRPGPGLLSARSRATGATGTAARAIRASACTSARRSPPSAPRSPTRRSTSRPASPPCDVGDLTVASVYVPNGGKDFAAKMRFLEALDAYAASFAASGRQLVLCGDLNVARTDRDVHPKERKPRRHRPAAGGARAHRAHPRPRPRRRRPRARSGQRRAVHVVGAVAQHAAAQHRLAARLRASPAQSLASRATACPVQADVGTSDHAPVVATFA